MCSKLIRSIQMGVSAKNLKKRVYFWPNESLSRIVQSNFLLVFTTSFLAWYLLLFSYFSLQILSGLYIGNFRDSKDAKQLDLYKITHILSIHDEARKLFKAISVFVPFCSHYVYLRKHHSRNRWRH